MKLITHRKAIRAVGQTIVVRRENVLAKFNEIASEEERGLFKGFPPSEQFTIKPFAVRLASPRLSPNQIIAAVAKYYYLRAAQLVGHSRYRQTTVARWVAIYFVRERFPALSLNGIGMYFSNRDHSTVIHALRETRRRIAEDADFRVQVADLAKLLEESDEMALVDV